MCEESVTQNSTQNISHFRVRRLQVEKGKIQNPLNKKNESSDVLLVGCISRVTTAYNSVLIKLNHSQ